MTAKEMIEEARKKLPHVDTTENETWIVPINPNGIIILPPEATSELPIEGVKEWYEVKFEKMYLQDNSGEFKALGWAFINIY